MFLRKNFFALENQWDMHSLSVLVVCLIDLSCHVGGMLMDFMLPLLVWCRSEKC